MLIPNSQHLSAEELDLLLLGTPAPKTTSHLETCAACRKMAHLDGAIVSALASLPQLAPRHGFANRVMAQVRVAPLVAPAAQAGPTPREQSARRRLAVGSLVGGGVLAAGFAWAATNQSAALEWVNPGLQSTGQSLWVSLQSLSANASTLPWFSSVSEALATPSRLVLTACAAGALYAVGLIGFRQLLTEPTADAAY